MGRSQGSEMFFFGDKYFKLVAVDQPSDRNQEPKFAISFLQKSAAQAVSLKEHRHAQVPAPAQETSPSWFRS